MEVISPPGELEVLYLRLKRNVNCLVDENSNLWKNKEIFFLDRIEKSTQAILDELEDIDDEEKLDEWVYCTEHIA